MNDEELISLKCANCRRDNSQCRLHRCSACNLRYYCSEECMKANWNVHKPECKQAQKLQKTSRRDLDPNHPFERAIITFEAHDFTDETFTDFVTELTYLFFADPATGEYIRGMKKVTEPGYVRLITLTARALDEYPDNSDVIHSSFAILCSYSFHYWNGMEGPSCTEAIFNSNLLLHIGHCLKSYSSDSLLSYRGWSLLAALSHADRKSYIKKLDGLLDIAIETLKANGRDESICCYVMHALAQWLPFVQLRSVSISLCDHKALALNVVLCMRRYPAANDIQGFCNQALRALCEVTTVGEADIAQSPVAVALASMGAFELVVTGIQRFPTSNSLVRNGAKLLKFISEHYFAERTKPRRTDTCVVLIATLQLFASDYGLSYDVIDCIQHIIHLSPASGAAFVRSGDGLPLMCIILQANLGKSEIVESCSSVVSHLCGVGMSSICAEFPHFLCELELGLLPLLVYGMKNYMNRDVSVVFGIMSGLANYATEMRLPFDEITEVILEAMRLYPSHEDIQSCGGGYCSNFGIAFKG